MKPEKTKRNISLENILNRELKRCTTNPKPYYVYPLEIKNYLYYHLSKCRV